MVASLAAQVAILSISLLTSSTRPGFAIDDGYIYSTYVVRLLNGNPFHFNAGEPSGGITSFAWYSILALTYLPVRLFWFDPQGLIWAAYLAGFVCLGVTVVLSYRLLLLVGVSPTLARLLSLILTIDFRLLWGVYSGLEVPLTAAFILTLSFVFLTELRLGRLRFTPYLAGIAPLVRPELVILPIAIGATLRVGATRTPSASAIGQRGKPHFDGLARYAVRAIPLLFLLPAIYLFFTGLPLPSSIYAKSHALASVPLSQAKLLLRSETITADFWPMASTVGGFAAATALIAMKHPSRNAATLISICLVGFVGANLVGGPFTGQMQRYLSPFDPLALVAIGFLASPLFERIQQINRVSANLKPYLLGVIAIAGAAYTYLSASGHLVRHVQNINQGPVAIANWVSKNTPTDAVVAAEAVGALGLFSERKIVDIYGLTTPDMLGHYFDWEFTWQYLRSEGAEYFVYYPSWFPDRQTPHWLKPLKFVFIRDNEIAGESVLGIYKIEWPSMGGWSSPYSLG